MDGNDTDSIMLRHAGGEHALGSGDDERMSTFKVWISALGFVTVINLSSVMGIIFFPLMGKSFYTIVMRTMIGLAIGSLSGSALFHLIPAAFDLESRQDPEAPKYINIALLVWLAAWTVMLLECGIKIGVKMRAKQKVPLMEQAALKGTDSLSEEEIETGNPIVISNLENGVIINGDASGGTKAEIAKNETMEANNLAVPAVGIQNRSRETLPVYRSTLSLSKTLQEAASNADVSSPEQIKTVAWIIIIGDSLHNFIDGVSIGTAFMKSFHTGAVISLAIICEEFPHELGDFAILINSGFTVKKALLFNFLSALTCYLGMALGILLGEISWDSYIFAFAAGIFLYVALADMVPEVTSLTEEVSEISPKSAIKVLLNHNLGILTGVIILYVLAIYQP